MAVGVSLFDYETGVTQAVCVGGICDGTIQQGTGKRMRAVVTESLQDLLRTPMQDLDGRSVQRYEEYVRAEMNFPSGHVLYIWKTPGMTDLQAFTHLLSRYVDLTQEVRELG